MTSARVYSRSPPSSARTMNPESTPSTPQSPPQPKSRPSKVSRRCGSAAAALGAALLQPRGGPCRDARGRSLVGREKEEGTRLEAGGSRNWRSRGRAQGEGSSGRRLGASDTTPTTGPMSPALPARRRRRLAEPEYWRRPGEWAGASGLGRRSRVLL